MCFFSDSVNAFFMFEMCTPNETFGLYDIWILNAIESTKSTLSFMHTRVLRNPYLDDNLNQPLCRVLVSSARL